MFNQSQNAENGMWTNDQVMFCLLEFEVKFETKNGAIFMFKENKVLLYTMRNQGRNQYVMAFFQEILY